MSAGLRIVDRFSDLPGVDFVFELEDVLYKIFVPPEGRFFSRSNLFLVVAPVLYLQCRLNFQSACRLFTCVRLYGTPDCVDLDALRVDPQKRFCSQYRHFVKKQSSIFSSDRLVAYRQDLRPRRDRERERALQLRAVREYRDHLIEHFRARLPYLGADVGKEQLIRINFILFYKEKDEGLRRRLVQISGGDVTVSAPHLPEVRSLWQVLKEQVDTTDLFAGVAQESEDSIFWTIESSVEKALIIAGDAGLLQSDLAAPVSDQLTVHHLIALVWSDGIRLGHKEFVAGKLRLLDPAKTLFGTGLSDIVYTHFLHSSVLQLPRFAEARARLWEDFLCHDYVLAEGVVLRVDVLVPGGDGELFSTELQVQNAPQTDQRCPSCYASADLFFSRPFRGTMRTVDELVSGADMMSSILESCQMRSILTTGGPMSDATRQSISAAAKRHLGNTTGIRPLFPQASCPHVQRILSIHGCPVMHPLAEFLGCCYDLLLDHFVVVPAEWTGSGVRRAADFACTACWC
eukprot:TRINITY_DN752_c0_g1_i2.p1 TRINITY_DN752_c0_g1~~TRINITY_DN752_c0_g1_i2.p1  ORF type:complete len:516 (+),score=78.11 TRINITY_DN752_c0_g1_i2:365-1912(+)